LDKEAKNWPEEFCDFLPRESKGKEDSHFENEFCFAKLKDVQNKAESCQNRRFFDLACQLR